MSGRVTVKTPSRSGRSRSQGRSRRPGLRGSTPSSRSRGRSAPASSPSCATSTWSCGGGRAGKGGGLGDVFLAEDEQLGRSVALKQLQERHRNRSRSREQFLFEAKVTGLLEHPGIVPVYSLERGEDGLASYTMRFIVGESLQEA